VSQAQTQVGVRVTLTLLIGASLGILAACSQASSPAPASASPPASTAGAGAKVAVVYGSLAGNQLPLWVAQDAGIFRQNGIDASLQLLTGSAAIATLVSGEMQVAQVGGSEVLNAAANGVDMAFLATISPRFDFIFVGAPGIKSFADLKGKTVGIAPVGGTIYIATRIVFKRAGLDFDKDVNLVQMGVTQERVAALEGGSIQATMVDVPLARTLKPKGYNFLYDMAAEGIPNAGNSVVAKRSWLSANREAAQRYIDSIMEGMARTRQDKALATATYKKFTKSGNDTEAQDTYEYFLPAFQGVPYPKPEQLTDTRDIMAEVNPKVRSLDLASLLDDSFVKNAVARGVGTSGATR